MVRRDRVLQDMVTARGVGAGSPDALQRDSRGGMRWRRRNTLRRMKAQYERLVWGEWLPWIAEKEGAKIESQNAYSGWAARAAGLCRRAV